ncbi:S8 family serine peptidase [Reichenbachiella versicolor]|uniref:S8 family serine peptidase n=1 Tax=Reichenbachiella versicolor TaxID=1821036 RepID=UPI001FE8095B|nr:S8 family serine peptidase [Reichenbachiella versicolor]
MKQSFESKAQAQRSLAIQEARSHGWAVQGVTKDGSVMELQKVENGNPIYFVTHNVDAAVSTRTNHLNSGGSLGLSLNGDGMTAHVWDGGIARATHQEYDGPGGNNRFSAGDGGSINFHASHVTGTIMASGVDADAKGMAPQANVIGYDWNSDLAEMTSEAASGMIISNHSYGYRTRNDAGQVLLPQYYFGGYITESRDVDEILFNAPFYLMVSSAGNDGEDNTATQNPTGGFGFDKLTAYSTAKNNLVIASADDATVSANGTLQSVGISSFSSEGPTDDFRIKPDIAGNGRNVYSTYHQFDSHYASISGTSMSSPNVTGSLLLLQEHYSDLNGTVMRAATLKGLALHTADDAGVSGPDAVFGWGLLNTKKAAEAITDNGTLSMVEELTLSAGQTYTITVDADTDSSTPLMASISWTDRPGQPVTTVNSTTPVLVNDLDIRVTKGGTTSFPYRLTSATTSSKSDNTVDPFERVDIGSASGTYTITVTHKGSLVGGSQNYSLIVTGISTTAAVCNATVPTGLSATESTLSWNPVPGASYNIRYRQVGTSSWTTVSTSSTSITLTGLTPETSYQAQVRSVCSSGTSSYSSSITFTTPGLPPVEYCDTEGQTSSFEWIDLVSFGGMTNATGNNGGYEDFTSLVATVSKGRTYTMTTSTGFSGTAYLQHFRVWIDYNQDGTFASSEVVFTSVSSTSGNRTGSVTIPSSALTGSTRMRVSMRYNAAPDACETFAFGEVEDYTVNITGPSSSSTYTASNERFVDDSFEEESEFSINIYPVPAKDFITIEASEMPESVSIYSSTGRKVEGATLNKSTVDVSNLSTGIYLIITEIKGKTYKSRFIKE